MSSSVEKTGSGSFAGTVYREVRSEGLLSGLKSSVETHLSGGNTATLSGDTRDPDFFDDADKSGLDADREVRMSNGEVIEEDVRKGIVGDPNHNDDTLGPDFFDDADLSGYGFDKEVRMRDGEIIDREENTSFTETSPEIDEQRDADFFDDADLSNYDVDSETFEDGESFDNTGLDIDLDDSYLEMGSKVIELEYLSDNIDDISSDYMSEGKLAGMASIALADGTSSIWKDRWDNIMGYDTDKGKAVKVADKETEMAQNYDKMQEKVNRVREKYSQGQSMKEEMIEDSVDALSLNYTSQDPVSTIDTAFTNSGLSDELYESLGTNTRNWLENYETEDPDL